MKRVFKIAAAAMLFLAWSVNVWAWPSVYPTGTTIYDPEKSFNGYTLYSPMIGQRGATDFYSKPCKAYLVDMNGNVVHEWKLPFPPGLHVELLPNGHLLAAGRTDRLKPEDRFPLKFDLDGIAGWIYELDWNGKVLKS